MLTTITSTTFADFLRLVFDYGDPRQVARILSQKLVEQLRIGQPPVDPHLFLSHYGIHLLEWAIPSEGFLTSASRLNEHVAQFPWVGEVPSNLKNAEPDAPVIVVRRLSEIASDSHRRRQRFIKMHEFAHWYLRDRIRATIRDVEFRHNDPDEEMLCNMMAAEILVPSVFFSEDVSDPEALVSRAVDLTAKYDVSLQTLLVKAAASVEGYAAFALFGRNFTNAKICFTTPVRSQPIFRDDNLQRDVMLAFDQAKTQHGTVHVMLGGKARDLGAFHVPIEKCRQVLSFVYAEPFGPRSFHAV